MILDEGLPISFGEAGKIDDSWGIWRGKITMLMIIMNTFPRHGWQEPKEVPESIKDTLPNFEHQPSLIWDCECDKIVNSPSYNYNRICDRQKTILAVLVFLYK
jgi:hypothetical protein|tara:strand:+ start:3471 stop:3779 length:309 start_codon:yes stop_codon:yes gene_type:complete